MNETAETVVSPLLRAPVRVRDAMTAVPVTLHVGQYVRDALTVFASKPFHHLPVVNGTKVVGIVSDHDLLAFLAQEPQAGYAKISKVMIPSPKGVDADTVLSEAIRMVTENRISSLLVFEGEGKDAVLKGIVTRTDLLDMFFRVQRELERQVQSLLEERPL
jgi:IMP dehydrogenase/acetoin utilization protein AcuB